MKRRISQPDLVLDMLRKGVTVTKLTAVHNGIGNINDVIMRLRRRGYNIINVVGKDLNGDTYTKYVLKQGTAPHSQGNLYRPYLGMAA